MEREYIKDFYGRILGSIVIENNGDKTVRDFHGRILGYYDKANNVTRDFHKRIIARGDQASGLIYMNK